jgi:Spy/CpxP family protein refolding chaperone
MNDARARMIEIRKQSSPRFREVRQQTDERLKTILTPEQWSQWQRMTSEMRGRRR